MLADLMQRAAQRPPALAELSDNLVFGDGDPDADLMIVGEAPGEDEDATGLPFVGRAGQLLDKILSSVAIARDEVYITNMVKFRPPGNRNPTREEIAASVPVLLEQIRLIRPQIIVTLGNVPTQWFLDTQAGITKTRGQWASWQGIALLPMYHPAYLLRNPSREVGSPKWQTWQDAKGLKAALVMLNPKPRGHLVIDTAAATPLFEP
jgi:DNA polymerase